MSDPGRCGIDSRVGRNSPYEPEIGAHGGCGLHIPNGVDGRRYVIIRTERWGDLLFHAECAPAGTVPLFSRGLALEQERERGVVLSA